MTHLAIIDYGSGNLRSAAKAFERVARERGGGLDVRVTADADLVRAAERVVLPGVGAFADCKQGLAAVPGMLETLDEVVIRGGRPFLGICVGMQLMAAWGREFEDCPGLGWIPGEVVPIRPDPPTLKIPHMGWNGLSLRAPDHPLFKDIADGAHAYFVHSFHLATERADLVLASVDYGGPVTAAVGRDNIAGTQFHPEKSQAVGLTLIRNFLDWRP